MIIDFHTHCFPDPIAERAIPLLVEKGDIVNVLDGKVLSLKKSMQENGVDYSVMLQIATKPTQNTSVNKWAVERMEEHGLIPFGSIHPDSDDWEAQLDYLKTSGIKGVKLHPEYQGFFVDDAKMIDIYKKIDSLGLVLVFHAGVDIGYPPPIHCTPQRVLNVYQYLPKGRTVLAHMGGWGLWHDVDTLLSGSDIYFDTSFCYDYMSADQMSRMIRHHSAELFLMASDSPWESQGDAIKTITRLNISEEDKTKILGGNAAKLLSL